MKGIGLVETFLSLQGEGYHAGRQAFFIRMAGCNLDCVFAEGAICDTPWRKAVEFATIPELIERAKDYKFVILTGGEPTIHPRFDDLVYALKETAHEVAIESNGTRFRESLNSVDHLVVSPKESYQERTPIRDGQPLAKVLKIADELRLVVNADTPLDSYEWWAHRIAHAYLSPATIADGSGAVDFRGFAPFAVERALAMIALNPKWRLSIQTHKILGVP